MRCISIPSFLGTAFLSVALAAPLAGQGYTQHAGLVYGTYVDANNQTQELLLDLYIPDGATTPLPLVIWIHGGGWAFGDRGNDDQGLTRFGFAVASIDYRLTPAFIWPTQIQDCKGAVRFLRANAAQYGLDPDRFGAFGPSAGAQLAACLGTMGDVSSVPVGRTRLDLEGTVGGNANVSSRVQAVVDWYGPTNLLALPEFPSTLMHGSALSPGSQLIGEPLLRAPELALTVSAITYASPADPPMLIVHGTDDTQVPFNQSELLEADLSNVVGTQARLMPIQGGGHGGTGFLTSDVAAFFQQHLADLPPVTVSVSVDAATAREAGAIGAIRITRSGAATEPLAVRVQLGGTATQGRDYSALGTLVTIPADEDSVVLTVNALTDGLIEGTETVELDLCHSPDYRIDQSSARGVVSILDAEGSLGRPRISVASVDARASERAASLGDDPAVFRFSRTGLLFGEQDITYRISGTAQSGVDFPSPPAVIRFPRGQATVDLEILPFDDADLELPEFLRVEVLPGTDYVLASASDSAKLFDDDRGFLSPVVNVVVADADAREGSGKSGAFLLTRTGLNFTPLIVSYSVGGTAAAGSDFVTLSGTATVAAGDRSVRVEVVPLQDTLREGAESVVLTIAPDSGYQTSTAPSQVIWIADDEGPTPPAGRVQLDIAPMQPGGVFVATHVGRTPGSLFGLWIATRPAYVPLGSAGILLIDPTSGQQVARGVFGAGSSAVVGMEIPTSVPGALGVPLFFQSWAAAPGMTQLELSNRITRRFR